MVPTYPWYTKQTVIRWIARNLRRVHIKALCFIQNSGSAIHSPSFPKVSRLEHISSLQKVCLRYCLMTTTTDPVYSRQWGVINREIHRCIYMILGATNSVLALWHCSLTSCKKEAVHILASWSSFVDLVDVVLYAVSGLLLTTLLCKGLWQPFLVFSRYG